VLKRDRVRLTGILKNFVHDVFGMYVSSGPEDSYNVLSSCWPQMGEILI
jgi:hypothetical protein